MVIGSFLLENTFKFLKDPILKIISKNNMYKIKT